MNPVQEIRRLWQCVCELNVAATGPEGPPGPEGPQGQEGPAGSCMQLPYIYSVLDDQAPDPGFFQIDAGSIFINGIDNNGEDRTATFDSLTTGKIIFTGASGVYYYADITAQAENAGIYELTISFIDGVEPEEDVSGCILFIPDSVTPTPSLEAVLAVGNDANGGGIINISGLTGPTPVAGSACVMFLANNDGRDVDVECGTPGVASGDPGGGYHISLKPGDGAGADGQFKIENLPTADPSVSNATWSDGGVLVRSGSTLSGAVNALSIPIAVKTTAANYTVGTTDPRELYGGVIRVTAACTITLPAVATGMSFTIITIGAVAVVINPDNADKIYLDGTALADGDSITNLSTAGDIAVFSYAGTDGFDAITNGWTDTN